MRNFAKANKTCCAVPIVAQVDRDIGDQKLQRDSVVNCTNYSLDEEFWKYLIFYKMADV